MGKGINGQNQQNNGAGIIGEQTDKSADSSNKKGGKDESGNGAGGSDAGSAQKEVTLGLSVLDDPKPLSKDERNAKRREAYAAKKLAEGKTVRKRKTKTENDNLDVTPLIIAVFGILSSRDGMAHWSISPQEAKAIGDPLNKLLSDSQIFAELNNHSDAVALVIACATIILPRLAITVSTKTKNGGKKIGKNITTDTIRGSQIDNQIKSGNNGNSNDIQNKSDGVNFMRRLY